MLTTTVGMDVAVGNSVGAGVSVAGTCVSVGETGVEAGAHALNKIDRNTNTRETDSSDFFMAYLLLI